jgi:small subunit ribosomal protein S21
MARASRVSIQVKEWEPFTRAWKRFEKKVDDANVFEEFRNHEFYEKPSNRNKREKAFAKSRERKRQNENLNVIITE